VIHVDLYPLNIEYVTIQNIEQQGSVVFVTGTISVDSELFEWDTYKDNGDRDWTVIGEEYSTRFSDILDQIAIENEIHRFLAQQNLATGVNGEEETTRY